MEAEHVVIYEWFIGITNGSHTRRVIPATAGIHTTVPLEASYGFQPSRERQ